jgi:RNA-directed DNA polymerase
MDTWMFCRAQRYAKHAHPNKSQKWCYDRYWGRLNPERKGDKWVFGDKHKGRYLLKFEWFKIERHTLVQGTSSPDDPNLRDYWGARRKVNMRRLSKGDLRLAEAQDWRCPVCRRDLIVKGEELHRHDKKPRCEGGTDASSNRELVHLYCHQQRHAKLRRERQAADSDEQAGLEL